MLHKNRISTLHVNLFIKLRTLEFIRLSHNYIKFIDKSLFKYNKNLKVIYLAYNEIKYFNIILDNFPQLTHVGLQHNRLPTLEKHQFYEFMYNKSKLFTTYDRYINIGYNKFKCNRSMDWLGTMGNMSYTQIGNNVTFCEELVYGVYNLTLSCYVGVARLKYPEFSYKLC